MLSGAEAHALGMVNHVWPAAELAERAWELEAVEARLPLAAKLGTLQPSVELEMEWERLRREEELRLFVRP